MKVLSSLVVVAVVAMCVVCVSAIPLVTRATDESNPFAGKTFYGNAYYRSLVETEVGRLKAAGKTELAAKAAKVAQIPVFSWIYDTSSVNDITGYLEDAAAIQKKTGKKQIVQLVIYNLPERDCSSKAAAGELHLTTSAAGVTPYQKLLESAKSQIQKFPDIAVAIVLEPDSIGDLVASNSVAKCKNSAKAHKQLLSTAIATLQLPNVSLYLDGAHAGWLGDSLAPTAALLGEILQDARIYHANATVRGLATNVSNYNGLGNQKEAGRDELKYIKALAPYLEKVGYPAHFIVDQGRAGNQKAPHGDGEEWCNFKYAGFGLRPMVTTHPLVDAVVWVKPGGESDGTTDTSSSRFDTACTSPASYVPSPEAGDWHSEMFRLLIEQANPSF
ncbi:Glycosyl hydrolases family 6, partial [Rhizoctonia solani]